MVEFFIQNSEYGVEHSSYKVTPTFSYRLKDMGTCNWTIALSQTDTNDDAIIADEFAPKRTDYLLRVSDDGGATFTNLQGGRILGAGLNSDTGLIELDGKDWLEYLDQPFPLDYSLTTTTIGDNIDMAFRAFITGSGTDTGNVIYNATQKKIIQHILAAASDLSDITYTSVFTGTGWTQVLKYFIEFLDEETMLGAIKQIGDLQDPFGFDYWCDWQAKIHFHSPRFIVDPDSVTPLISLEYGDDAVVECNWRNTGPKATRTVAQNGVGIWSESVYMPSVDVYRDYLEFVTLGEGFNYGTTAAEIQNIVDRGADAQGTKDRNPQKDLTLKVVPTRLFPDDEISGFEPMVGKAINYDSLNEFDPYHRIDADYWIVSQDYEPQDDSGNYTLSLGLQQIYPL